MRKQGGGGESILSQKARAGFEIRCQSQATVLSRQRPPAPLGSVPVIPGWRVVPGLSLLVFHVHVACHCFIPVGRAQTQMKFTRHPHPPTGVYCASCRLHTKGRDESDGPVISKFRASRLRLRISKLCFNNGVCLNKGHRGGTPSTMGPASQRSRHCISFYREDMGCKMPQVLGTTLLLPDRSRSSSSPELPGELGRKIQISSPYCTQKSRLLG